MKRCPICRTTYPGLQAQFCPADGSVLETVSQPVDPLVGTTLEGKYKIEKRLGAGGMGAVYKAHHALLGRDVAVKVLRSEMLSDAKAAERFRREAQAAARIDHPNAVTIYDFGISPDGSAYLVMELLRGTSLRDVLDRDGAIPLARAVEIFVQVCAGIDRAHQLGVIHRDIKPDNIMVDERPDGTTGVKVVDFGIAMLQDMAASGGSRLTGTGMVVGTANYMSPEHCRGAEMDRRSDIYSLGIVLYEMLTGRVPFEAPLPSAVIVAHVNDAPPPPTAIRPDIPPAVERVVLDALAKRPESRPATASELGRRLVAAASGVVATDAGTVVVAASPAPGGPTSGRPSPVTSPDGPTMAVGPVTPPTMLAYQHTTGTGQQQAQKSGLSPAVVAVVAFAMLAVGAAVAAATFGVINYRNRVDSNVANVPPTLPRVETPPTTNAATPPTSNANANTNAKPVATPPADMPTNIGPIAPEPDTTGERRSLSQAEEREIEGFLSDWISSSQARDVDRQMSFYADVVDYYRAGPVPQARVRADRVKAYTKYDQIELRIVKVTVASATIDGTQFRLVFDKEWDFSGVSGESKGKVRELLELRRVDGQLKIVKEQDLSVY